MMAGDGETAWGIEGESGVEAWLCGRGAGGRARSPLPARADWAAGVDEVGRGPLAGPVVAAAVVLHPRRVPDGLRDSKQLTARRRVELAALIRREALAWTVALAEVVEIDRVNVLRASLLAMTRAVEALPVAVQRVRVDGREVPQMPATVTRVDAVIGGDATVAQISAASILAKVWRDEYMVAADRAHPAYGFARHKGYATREHLAALERYGPCALHRRSFAPVAAAGATLFGPAELDPAVTNTAGEEVAR